MRHILILGALALAACGGDNKPRPISAPPNAVSAWQIGPIVGNTNYSKGLPINPAPYPDAIFAFQISPIAEPHYVSKLTGPVSSGTVRLRGAVVGDADAHIYGKSEQCTTASNGALTLYLERQGAWSTMPGDGGRWWATQASIVLSGPGEFQIDAPLDGFWSSVETWTNVSHPEAWADAKRHAYRIGLTFGDCTGYGHGVKATKPVTFIVKSFEIIGTGQ